MSGEVMAMVILSYVICLSLGASIGLLGAGFCAAASDKPPTSIERKGDADGPRLGEQRSNVNKRLALCE
jgi:hypothetical protein